MNFVYMMNEFKRFLNKRYLFFWDNIPDIFPEARDLIAPILKVLFHRIPNRVPLPLLVGVFQIRLQFLLHLQVSVPLLLELFDELLHRITLSLAATLDGAAHGLMFRHDRFVGLAGGRRGITGERDGHRERKGCGTRELYESSGLHGFCFVAWPTLSPGLDLACGAGGCSKSEQDPRRAGEAMAKGLQNNDLPEAVGANLRHVADGTWG